MDRSFLDAIPRELRYEPLPLAEERNALGAWQRATSLVAHLDMDEEPFRSILGHEPDERSADEPHEPINYDSPRLAQAFEENAAALACLDEGLACGNLRFADPTIGANEALVVDLKKLVQLLNVRAHVSLAHGALDAAAADLRRLVRIATLVLRGGGDRIMSLVGLPLLRIALHGIRDALEQLPSSGAVHALLESCPTRGELCDAVIASFKVELRDYAVQLASDRVAQSDPHDPITVLRAMEHEPPKQQLQAHGPAPLFDFESVLREFVAGHPDPFNRRTTLEQMVAVIGRVVRRLERARWGSRVRIVDGIRQRVDEFRQRRWNCRAKCWPNVIVERLTLGEANYEEYLSDERSLGREVCEFLQSSEGCMKVRRALRRVDNPVGMLLVGLASPFTNVYVETVNLAASELAECQRLAQGTAA